MFVSLTKSDCNQAQITVSAEIQPRLPTIVADPVGLRQVLINLIRNAIDAFAGVGTPNDKTDRRSSSATRRKTFASRCATPAPA